MSSETDLARIGSVVGEPARARMLLALIDRRARTAKELAFLARVSPATASAHLSKLLESKLVTVEPQGRHRYFRLTSALVGQMIETMAIVADDAAPPVRKRPRVDETLAIARTCYDHLAGRLAVGIADALQDRGAIGFADGAGEVTARGQAFFAELGIDLRGIGPSRRVFCRPCIDWTERRHHLAGAVGAALCEHCLAQGWLQRKRASRALTITPQGAIAFADMFGVDTALLGAAMDRAVA
jgi:DNA-binding transcriptional ArsR family regulator